MNRIVINKNNVVSLGDANIRDFHIVAFKRSTTVFILRVAYENEPACFESLNCGKTTLYKNNNSSHFTITEALNNGEDVFMFTGSNEFSDWIKGNHENT